ncbi:sensor histidine kinase [Ideonella sp. BN130291]|uniref:sensor histidine kinase n=1 Tax=Ideonella sp. BN130291 TaxID=3112940 RepID=UPI002E2739FF|nr:ATP-binding protein [Ideonella sp. BN130291]
MRRLCLVLLALVLWLPAAQAQLTQAIRFSSAWSLESPAAHFPTDVPARLVPLPDDWAVSRPGHAGPVWYRVSFDAPGARDSSELLALYIDRVCSSFEVYLNGQLVHRDGSMTPPVRRNCQRPQLIALPSGLMQHGNNTLDLRVLGRPLEHVASHQRAGGVSVLDLGPYAQLAEVHARRIAWRVTLPQVVSATLLLLGCFMFVMGWRHRKASYLAYFGALCATWSVVTARLWLRNVPLPAPWSEVFITALLPFVVLCAVQFLLRYAGRRDTRVTVALWLQCLLLPAAVLLFGEEHVYQVASASYGLLALETTTVVAFYLRWTRAERPSEFPIMVFWLGLMVVLIAAEFASQQGQAIGLAGDFAHVAIPVVFVAIGLRLVQHYARALQTAEEGRVTLEARIREATAEIERNFAQLAELRVEQVTERERKRIAADLHDDLGAKLLTIVHTSESERISTLAREALEEMRLSVRGLTGKPVRLIDALGDWRAEVVSRLAQAGIEADWNSPTDDVPQTLSARAYVQTTRILREAVSNIIKHSAASHCTVACTVAESDFQLIVQDNGRGIPLELDGRLDRGHGMSSMKHRAKQLQGQCLVESGPGYGTVIRLTLPL